MTHKQDTTVRTLHFLKPVRAMLRDMVNAILTIASWIICIYTTWAHSERIKQVVASQTQIDLAIHWLWLAALLLPPLFWLPYQWILSRLMVSHKRIHITPNIISYRRFWIRRRFDTDLPHKFVLLEHPWASFEKRCHAIIGQKSRWLKPYFGRSKVLALEVMGEPHRITSIYGIRNSRKHLHKLNALTAAVQAKSRTGRGIAIDTQDEWSNDAGDLRP